MTKPIVSNSAFIAGIDHHQAFSDGVLPLNSSQILNIKNKSKTDKVKKIEDSMYNKIKEEITTKKVI